MKIRSASVLLFSRDLDGTAWNPAFRWTQRRAPLLMLETAGGGYGLGEAWSRYDDLRPVLDVLSSVVAPALAGLEVDGPLGCADRLRRQAGGGAAAWAEAAAFSAADMALWDAAARAANQPVWRFLGGAQGSAKVYASGGLYRDGQSLQALRDEARGYRRRGFDAMKMKVGGVGMEQDLQRVAAVRDGLGAEAELWVDAVGQFDRESACRFGQEAAVHRICAVQSPLPADDIAGLALLNRKAFPVVAGEAEHDPIWFGRLLEAQAASRVQYCLALCGGFSAACRLDDRARAAGIRSTPQCFSTVIAQAATLHFAAARDNVEIAEFHCFHDHLAHLYLPASVPIRDGYAKLADAPGLGVAVPWFGSHPDGSRVAPVARFEA